MSLTVLQDTTDILNKIIAAEILVSAKAKDVHRRATKTQDIVLCVQTLNQCCQIWEILQMLLCIIGDTQQYGHQHFQEFLNLTRLMGLPAVESDDIEGGIYELLDQHAKAVIVVSQQIETLDRKQVEIRIPDLLEGIIEQHRTLMNQLLSHYQGLS